MDTTETTYSREAEITKTFNLFWQKVFGNRDPKDYAKLLTIEDWIELKKTLSDVNNMITLKVTQAFVDKLQAMGIINKVQANAMKKEVDSIHPNTNGFDVCWDKKEGVKLIAEVKCNIPVKPHEFGAAQKNGILKDLKGLKDGKRSFDGENTDNYYKFMVVLDVEGVRDAIKKLCGNECMEFVNNQIDKHHIYISFIELK